MLYRVLFLDDGKLAFSVGAFAKEQFCVLKIGTMSAAVFLTGAAVVGAGNLHLGDDGMPFVSIKGARSQIGINGYGLSPLAVAFKLFVVSVIELEGFPIDRNRGVELSFFGLFIHGHLLSVAHGAVRGLFICRFRL